MQSNLWTNYYSEQNHNMHARAAGHIFTDQKPEDIVYRIAGKFVELTLRAFGERKFGELLDQPIGYQLCKY